VSPNESSERKMKINNRTYHIKIRAFLVRCCIVFLLAVVFNACSNTKHLSESAYLYTGAKIEIESNSDIPKKGPLKDDLKEALYPEPNRKFLGIGRMRLWIYNIAGETEKTKGFKYWLKYKLGEPPVLLEYVNQENVSSLLKNRAFNRGHFKPVVSYATQTKKKKAQVVYTVEVRQPYRIGEVHFPDDSTDLLAKINALKSETLLEADEIYTLDLLESERERIRKALLNQGYYYFSPSHLFFEADTTEGEKTVALYVHLKDDVPLKSLKQYRIHDVYVYPNYALEDSMSTSCPDTLVVDNMHYISRIKRFRPYEITKVIYLDKGELYNRNDHEKTISRLIGMSAFKYVNIRFEQVKTKNSSASLDMFVYLTPEKVNSFRFEVSGIAKSNNFIGPGAELTYLNRNIFKGAEMLTLSTYGNWETQVGGNAEYLNSYEFGINGRLQYPRLETPFKIEENRQEFVPTTFIDLGYTFQQRVKYYTAHSLNAGFGYVWKNAYTSRNDLTLISIEYYQLGRTTELFREKLEQNPYLASTFKDQFMVGPRYSYTFNDQVNNQLRNHFYFQGRIDMSGLLINGVLAGLDALQQGNQETDSLFGNLYARYVKVDGDVRYYQNFKRENKLVYRLFAGVGMPFGNSPTLPYVKQYYVGGTNGIRAFRARSVGPGTYHPPDTANVIYAQTGDIKLELDVEFRFNIQGVVNGALFLDAGNIWLIKKTEDVPGAEFRFDKFYKQIAVGSGFGLRFDFSFMVLRLDLGVPLRKPWLPQGQRWVVNDIFGYSGWAGDNLVLNIAIGYPF